LLVGYIPPVCALLAPCQAGASTPETTSLFPDGPLTPYAVEARYPGLWEEVTAVDHDEAVTVAERVVRWAQALVERSAQEPE